MLPRATPYRISRAVTALCLLSALLLSACGQRGPLPPPDKTPPAVSETVPAEGVTDFPVTGVIKAVFSKKMDPATINGETVTLSSAGGNVPGAVVYTEATVIFTPAEPLREATLYTVTVSDQVKDIYGILMGHAFQFSFSTQISPAVLSTLPAKDAVDVPVNAVISIAFNKAVAPESISFSLVSEDLGTVACDQTVDAKGMNAQFIPKAVPPAVHGLAANTRYTATVGAGLRDGSGNTMTADHVWAFTTGALADTVPPGVKATTPANGAHDVSVNPSISVEFSESVTTVPTTTLTLFSEEDGAVPCQRIESSDTVHTFTPLFTPPAAGLAYNRLYRATLSAGARDGAGNAMPADHSWTFTTTLAPTLTAISAPDVPYNTDVNASVTVSSPAGTPAGTVSLTMDNGAAMIQALNSSGIAVFTIASKPRRGPHVLSATYAPQSGSIFQGSSGSAVFSVGMSTSSMNLASSANPSSYGTPVTFTATVSAGATGSVTFRDGDRVLGAVALSGNTASYSTDDLLAGDHAITASYDGDGNFSAATAALSQHVSKAALTVTANDISKDYHTDNPLFTARYSGFVNGDSSALLSGAPDLTTTAVKNSPPGSYLITAAAGTLSSSNYSFIFVNGTLTIINANATVTLDNLTQTYDGAPRPVTAATSPAGLAVTITYNGSTTVPTNAGSYTVVGTISDPNYTGTASGTLVIAKADAAVTLGNLSQVYDGTPKTPTFTTTPDGLAVSFTYNGSPTPPVNAGSYAVVGAVSNANYQGSGAGTLTIGKAGQAPLTVAATPPAVAYGGTSALTSAGGSGTGAVTYSAGGSTGCSVAGSTLTVTNAGGACSVTATKAADGNYNAAASAALPVPLTKANSNVTVWPTAAVITYGQTLASSTLSGGSATPAGSFAFTTPSTAPNAGTASQSVTFTPADTTNYTTVSASVHVTVAARPITITADAKAKLSGEPDPVLTYSITSGSLVDGDALSGALSREPGEGPGDYAILQGSLANSNYQITYISAKLTIQ